MLNLYPTFKFGLMKRVSLYLTILFIISCGRKGTDSEGIFITVSIAPFKYFVEEIGGGDFNINVMVPEGADPHIYEPFPGQIDRLNKSAGYISNGYLGFEKIWLNRFYETNRTMKRLCLGDNIDPLISGNDLNADHLEGADPHYWVSPRCAVYMALSVKEFLTEINPVHKEVYDMNYQKLLSEINDLDKRAQEMFSDIPRRSFIIFHPNLAYLARDYGLHEISLEYDGKEPSPSRLKELIDIARKDKMGTIFVQREYDTKNAKALAAEIDAKLIIIDPLSEDWLESTSGIINSLFISLSESTK